MLGQIELTPPTDRKNTQRQRLVDAVIDTTTRRGYGAATVSAIISEAGVSRPTFYDYFADRDDSLLQAIAEVQSELRSELERALRACRPEAAPFVAVGTLVSYAAAQPARGRFLMGESMAGGARALDERDEGIVRLAELIAEAQAGGGLAPDIDLRVMLGGVHRMIATRLRRGEPAIAKLADELQDWLALYCRPAEERRWRWLTRGGDPEPRPDAPETPLRRMPAVLPPGRPRLSKEEIAENHRLRILYAVAALAKRNGYAATTVADITKLASVDGRAFYRHFSDKQEAFTAVHALGFQQVMDVTAKAFFSVEGWPQRSWEAGRALAQLLQANPLVAHVGFVEAYAVGPGAVQRIEDSHTAFLFFLQEGLMHTPPGGAPSRVAMEAIVACVFEIIYLQTRLPEGPQIAATLPDLAHIWLTPFLGVSAADEFIDSQVALLRHGGGGGDAHGVEARGG